MAHQNAEIAAASIEDTYPIPSAKALVYHRPLPTTLPETTGVSTQVVVSPPRAAGVFRGECAAALLG
jgi:hypothetical protein